MKRASVVLLVLMAGCTTRPSDADGIACDRSGGWYTLKPSMPRQRWVCVREIVPTDTTRQEAGDAAK